MHLHVDKAAAFLHVPVFKLKQAFKSRFGDCRWPSRRLLALKAFLAAERNVATAAQLATSLGGDVTTVAVVQDAEPLITPAHAAAPSQASTSSRLLQQPPTRQTQQVQSCTPPWPLTFTACTSHSQTYLMHACVQSVSGRSCCNLNASFILPSVHAEHEFQCVPNM